MQFIFEEDAKNEFLQIKDENYNYLIKARRKKIGDEINIRNLNDNFLYRYKIVNIGKKDLSLELISKEEKIVEARKTLHLIWCVVDPKTIEKSIASLNELGVDKITFVYSEFSQKNFKINFERLEKILVNSSSQCGRSSIIKLEIEDSFKNILEKYKDLYILDFSNSLIDEKKDSITTLLIGPEGGFSQNERELFKEFNIVGFNSNIILKSETAVIAASAKILI